MFVNTKHLNTLHSNVKKKKIPESLQYNSKNIQIQSNIDGKQGKHDPNLGERYTKRFSELEDRTMEIMQSEKRKEKKMTK